MPKSKLLTLLIFLTLVALPILAQERGGRRPNREQMWPAATAEEWKRPVLIEFQRTWEDAVAVSRETGKPILACVNMDGEIASEHYAGIRYRQPEIAKLYEPYVCVIASTYRHNPRDYDEQGRRILCPRFGSVTCGEHIAIEPILFEKFLDGQRVAPRHIMIELDGKETYDVFYANDTDLVFEAIRQGISERKAQPSTVVRGDRSIVERVASPDNRDREAVEAAYREGDAAVRRSLLEAAQRQGVSAPIDLLRLAVFGLDVEQSRLARAALAQSESPLATGLIADALRVPMADAERDSLIAALERLGDSSPRARWLASAFRGLSGKSKTIDLQAWKKAVREYVPPSSESDLEDLVARQEARAGTYRASRDDAGACIELAEASLALAMKARKPDAFDVRMARIVARHMFVDARLAAQRAGKAGAAAWRVNTVLALESYYRGDPQAAYGLAEAAVKEMPPAESGWNSMAVLTIFAEGRYKAIKKAAKERRRWPSAWLTDLDAAYSAILHHPLGTVGQVLWHHDFLVWLGVNRRATRILRAGLARFPGSPVLHTRLRAHLLKDKGPFELEAVYDEMLREGTASDLEWFAGYAWYVAAESRRRAAGRERASRAYGRAIDLFMRAAKTNPLSLESSNHCIALALAGRARVAFENENDEQATEDIVASFKRNPGSAGTKDGLGITPAATAQMLIVRLAEVGKDDLVEKLLEAIGELDPALLVPEEE